MKQNLVIFFPRFHGTENLGIYDYNNLGVSNDLLLDLLTFEKKWSNLGRITIKSMIKKIL